MCLARSTKPSGSSEGIQAQVNLLKEEDTYKKPAPNCKIMEPRLVESNSVSKAASVRVHPVKIPYEIKAKGK